MASVSHSTPTTSGSYYPMVYSSVCMAPRKEGRQASVSGVPTPSSPSVLMLIPSVFVLMAAELADIALELVLAAELAADVP